MDSAELVDDTDLFFGFVIVFWDVVGLNQAVLLSKKNTKMRRTAGFLTAIEARLWTRTAAARELEKTVVHCGLVWIVET